MGKSNQNDKGLFFRFKNCFSYSTDDGHVVGEIPLRSWNGKCLICENNEADSEDHFPLKSMGNNGLWHYRNLHNVMFEEAELKIGICQNGISYKTICCSCNSKLGHLYDPHLLSLYMQFRGNGLRRISYDFNNLLRCLAGHFVATSISSNHEDLRIQELIRIYKHGEDLGYYIYVAPFSGVHSLVLNEMAYVNLVTRELEFIFAMKIHPFAIILTKKQQVDIGYTNLCKDKSIVRIVLDKKSNPFYPELYRGSDSKITGQLLGDCAVKSIVGVQKLWSRTNRCTQFGFEERLLAPKI